MEQTNCQSAIGSAGFGMVDFIIIGFTISVIAFVVVSNILAHAY